MQQVDAEPYQRIDSLKAHRNGYKERSLKTRVGEIRLLSAFDSACGTTRRFQGVLVED